MSLNTSVQTMSNQFQVLENLFEIHATCNKISFLYRLSKMRDTPVPSKFTQSDCVKEQHQHQHSGQLKTPQLGG